MADYDSSLPIRTEADGLDERLHSKLVDFADPDGTGKQVEVSEKLLHVRKFAKDSDGDKQEVLLSQEGHTQSNGDYDVTSNKRPSSQGLVASDRAATPSESTMNKRPTAVASTDGDTAVAMDVAIRDSQGDKIDEDNPLAIYMAESPAEEVDDFDEAVNVIKAATANHDYTVTALKELKSITVEGSASGKAKFELEIETSVGGGTFVTVAVAFSTTSSTEIQMSYKKKVVAGIIVRVAKTNLDNQVQSIYSQIQGLEI